VPGQLDVWTRVTFSNDTATNDPTDFDAAVLPANSAGATPSGTPRARRRWPLVAGLTVAALALSGGAVAYGSARKTVTLDVDGRTTTVTTFASSVEGLLESEGVRVDERDLVAPAADARLTDGADVVVRYGRQLTLQVDGKQSEAWVTALDADEALDTLAERGGDVRLVASRSGDRASLPIRLDADGPVAVKVDGKILTAPDGHAGLDHILAGLKVTIDADDRVSVLTSDAAGVTGADAPGVTVVVQRVATQDVTTTFPVPFETQTQQDANRYADQGAAVTQQGADGVRTLVERVTTVDGAEESRTVVSDGVTTQPVPKIVVEGTKQRPVSSGPSAGPAPAGSAREIGQQLAAERGWTGEQWTCLDKLFQKESGWNPSAENPSSGAYGIPQALPGSKMGTVAADWRTNPVTQITWGLNYIRDVYGTPCGAWSHSVATNWY
jgi:resuscitation-promoting factor RpfB